METPLSLRLLYTANLRGDIAILPRLFTLMQRLQAPRAMLTLILDLGQACHDSAWHCRATGGRSMLVALDAMGYHAANVGAALGASDRAKLAEQVTMALIDETHPWTCQLPAMETPIRLALQPDEQDPRLQIPTCARGSQRTTHGNCLRLQGVAGGQIGELQLDPRDPPGIIASAIHDLPPATPPNPTIAGAVEFVEAEARLYQRKQLRDASP